jgi:hypothetical protein
MLKDLVSKPVLDYFTAYCLTRIQLMHWGETELRLTLPCNICTGIAVTDSFVSNVFPE